jgi:membrane protein DedA with SNARE-associated domain
MAGERSLEGVAAGATGAGVPGLLGLLLAMEAGVPIPVPSDLVMLLLGERVSAGALPLWLAAAALELVALAGTAALFLAARGPGQALLSRFGPRLGLSGPRLDLIRSRLGLTVPAPRRTHPVPRRVPRWGSVAQARGGARSLVHRVVPGLAVGRATPGLRTVTVVAAASSGMRVGRALPALVLGSSVFLQAHLLLGYALGPAARELLERARLPVLVAAAVALAVVVVLLVRGRRGRATRVLAEGACPVCLAAGLLGGAGRPAPATEAPRA